MVDKPEQAVVIIACFLLLLLEFASEHKSNAWTYIGEDGIKTTNL